MMEGSLNPLVRKAGVKKDPNLEIKDADIYDYFEETTCCLLYTSDAADD